MNTYEQVQQWLQQSNTYNIPALDETGLSRAVINEKCIFHLLAEPNPEHYDDNLFMYIPLANISAISPENMKAVLYFIGKNNMMGGLPVGFRLGFSEESNFFWLSGRFTTEHMTHAEFDKRVTECVVIGERLYTELEKILKDEVQDNSLQISKDFAKKNVQDEISLRRNTNITWG